MRFGKLFMMLRMILNGRSKEDIQTGIAFDVGIIVSSELWGSLEVKSLGEETRSSGKIGEL